MTRNTSTSSPYIQPSLDAHPLQPQCRLLPKSSTPTLSSLTWCVLSRRSLPNLTRIVSLFQDGTLTDSIQAVEAAWGKVAVDIGQDPEHVIAATHGKRAVDNLAQFKPHIKSHEMDDEVTKFEESILYYADAYNVHGPGSRRGSFSTTPLSSGMATPELSSAASSAASSRASSFASPPDRRPSFGTRLGSALRMTAVPEAQVYEPTFEDGIDTLVEEVIPKALRHQYEAWQIEAAAVDRSVRILPGVKRVMDSIPAGRYAVATSGAKTYGKLLLPLFTVDAHAICSLRMHDSRWYHTAARHHHRRR